VTAAAPVGRILVGAVAPEERDALSPSQLRSMALGGVDPLDYIEEPTSGVEVLGNVHGYEVNGNFGNRIRFSYMASTGGSVVFEQVAVTDPALTRFYVLQVTCESECFEAHVDEIEEIIESFHIGAA
jgi:hypothetical protein